MGAPQTPTEDGRRGPGPLPDSPFPSVRPRTLTIPHGTDGTRPRREGPESVPGGREVVTISVRKRGSHTTPWTKLYHD